MHKASHLHKLGAEELLRMPAEVNKYQPLAEALGLRGERSSVHQRTQSHGQTMHHSSGLDTDTA